MPTYQPSIPTGLVNLDSDYANIQGNFAQANTVFGIDHTQLADTSAQMGYHKVIHYIPFSTVASNPPNNYPPAVPVPVVGNGQLFTAQINDGIAIDHALIFEGGTGNTSLLTRNFLPSSSPTNGKTFLPGGFILQWGQIARTGPATTVLFNADPNNINFPTACYSAILTPATSLLGSFGASSINPLGFVISSSVAYGGALFNWIAIGT